MVWNNYSGLDRSSFFCEEMPMAVSLTQLLQSLLQNFEYKNKLYTTKYANWNLKLITDEGVSNTHTHIHKIKEGGGA
jgi:hypothetical protein